MRRPTTNFRRDLREASALSRLKIKMQVNNTV